MSKELYIVYAAIDPNATHVSECPQIKVVARAHRQHIWTHTTLVGVSKTGSERLKDFFARYESQGKIHLDVPCGPILEDWETD